MPTTFAEAPAASASTDTRWIDLKLIDLPSEARSHTPEDLDSLAEDMKINGQLQEIIVVSGGERFTLVAGVGRTLAARKLGWDKIRALVKDVLSAFDQLHITFSENEEREDVSPLYQARLLERMKIAGNLQKLEDLSNKVGKSTGLLSTYLSLLGLDPKVRESFNALKLTLRQLLELKRLPNADLQIQVGEECAKTDLSGKALKARVDKLLKLDGGGRKAKLTLSAPDPKPADPLAPAWDSLSKDLPAVLFVNYKDPNQWTFTVQAPPTGVEEALAQTFEALARAVKAVGSVVATGPAATPELALTSATAPRIPKTPQEEDELVALATGSPGPGPLYAWIYGEDSPATQSLAGITWADASPSDPKEFVKKMLEDMRS